MKLKNINLYKENAKIISKMYLRDFILERIKQIFKIIFFYISGNLFSNSIFKIYSSKISTNV